jgi:hypothetical protein
VKQVEEIDLSRLLVDMRVNPRKTLDPRRLKELAESDRPWPPILVRPYCDPEHPEYDHQLVDGFHRVEVATRQQRVLLPGHVEGMTIVEMLCRALRENDGDYPLKVTPAEREQRVVDLARAFPTMTEQRIADETGIRQQTVSRYLDAAQMTHVSNLPPEQAAAVQQLPVAKRAALAQMLPKAAPKQQRHESPAARARRERQRQAARHLPAVAVAAAQKDVTAEQVAALIEAVQADPEHGAALIERTKAEQLDAVALRLHAEAATDLETPPEVLEHNAQPGALMRDREGRFSQMQLNRLAKAAGDATPHAQSMPAYHWLGVLFSLKTPSDEAIAAWLEVTPPSEWAAAARLFTRVAASMERVRALILEREREGSIRLVHRANSR